MKKLVFAVGSMAIGISIVWAQNGGSPNAPYGHEPGSSFYGGPLAASQPASPADSGFDPTAHYWDYYRLDPGRGIDVDRTTPP